MKVKFSFKSIGESFKKALKNKVTKRAGLVMGAVVAGVIVLFVVFNMAYQDKILPKTYIGGTNFGGLTQESASSKLTALIETNKDAEVKFNYSDKSFSRKISDLGIDYKGSSVQTVDGLMAVGRSGGIFKVISEQVRAVFARNNAVASFRSDDVKLSEFLSEIAKSVNYEAHDATIGFNNSEPYVEPEVIGQEFPISDNKKIALDKIGSLSFSTDVEFFVKNIYPAITTKMAEKALEKTRELLGRHLAITARDKKYEIKSEDIPGLLEFVSGKVTPGPDASSLLDLTSDALVPQFSVEKVGAFTDNIAKEVNQDAKDPQFKVEGGRVMTFQSSQIGYALSKDDAVKQIIAALNNNEPTIELVVKETKPSISSSDPAASGITELIGEGKTSWKGSPANRIHNLQLGASRISGTIVKPGEEFSAVKTISPITAAAGFLPELVIKNSTKVEPDIGGGLCQVSTTLFRAALNSGLKITARTAHSFRVSYYEPPVGMDATIYDPAPDLRFINNMDTPILIWSFAGSNSLTFQIYGTKDGRSISISDPVKYNYVSPPPAVYALSSSMAAGAIRQIERATAGVSASFTYKVTSKKGDVLSNDTFVSKYVAIPDMFLYGEGAAVPGVQGTAAQASPVPAPTPADTSTPSPSP